MLPAPFPKAGKLWIWPPLGHTFSKIRNFFTRAGVAADISVPQCLGLELSSSIYQMLRENLADCLSPQETADCRCLFLGRDEPIAIEHLGDVLSLETVIGRLNSRWLTEMIAGGRLETAFQPIVSVDEPLDVFGYECLLRGRDQRSRPVYPDAMFAAARSSKTMLHLDREARLTHIRSAVKHGIDGCVFINFNPTSIYDPHYCLKSTVEAIAASDIPPQRFVFEVVASDGLQDARRLPEILKFYRDAGFQVALDDVGAGHRSLNLLTKLKPDFVKFDMELIRNIDRDPYKASILRKLIEVARELEIKTVVVGVESVAQWQWSAENGADYAQGYLFGKPAPQPQSSFASSPAALGGDCGTPCRITDQAASDSPVHSPDFFPSSEPSSAVATHAASF